VVVLDWYCMCKRDRKIVEHLLLHYPIARELWELLFSQFGVCSIMTRGVVELFVGKVPQIPMLIRKTN
jgi:hypothetical protein